MHRVSEGLIRDCGAGFQKYLRRGSLFQGSLCFFQLDTFVGGMFLPRIEAMKIVHYVLQHATFDANPSKVGVHLWHTAERESNCALFALVAGFANSQSAPSSLVVAL